MSTTEKEAIVKSLRESAIAQRLSGFTKKITGDTAEKTEVKEESEDIDRMATSAYDMTALLVLIKKDWPVFNNSVEDFRKKLRPIFLGLNSILGIKTSIWFEAGKEIL